MERKKKNLLPNRKSRKFGIGRKEKSRGQWPERL
jgi:hypothetical protein